MAAEGFRQNHVLQGIILWLLVLWLVTAIDPLNRHDWLLENLLVFVYVGLLTVTYHRFTFTNASYALFAVFLSLHLIGAHYTYSETPIGFWVQEALGLSRNHYDRIVHFSYGLLCAYPIRDILLRAAGVRKSWSYFMSITVIVAFSGFFEVLESMAAVIVSPELGAAYLGTQGDVWDAQKDTFFAFLGATIAMLIIGWNAHRKRS